MDLLDRMKTRKGGCSSYSAVNDPYMLLDNAIVKSPATTTGGFKSLKDDNRRRRGGENNLNQEEMMDGGAKRKRRNKRKANKKSSKGGNPVSDFLNSFQNEKQTGGRHMRRGGYNEPASQVATNQPAPQVATNQPSPQVVNTPPQQSASNSLLGDAMGMLAKSANLSGITGGRSMKDDRRRRRGGTGVELAPFAAAVALLAARMLNDPEVRRNTKMGMGQSRRSSSKRRARA